MKYLSEYLEYLKYQKNYSDETIHSYSIDIEEFLDYINSDLDLIFICNPNNPTGVITGKDLLVKILIKAKKNNVMVIIVV